MRDSENITSKSIFTAANCTLDESEKVMKN